MSPFPAVSLTLPYKFMTNWIDPFPVPVETVTVYVEPEPLTFVMAAPFIPFVVKVKFDEFNPVIGSLKLTLKFMLELLVGDALARVMEVIVGWMISATVRFNPCSGRS